MLDRYSGWQSNDRTERLPIIGGLEHWTIASLAGEDRKGIPWSTECKGYSLNGLRLRKLKLYPRLLIDCCDGEAAC